MTSMNGSTERQEIEALLPWHAAGTLSRYDAERVEQALAADRELARHYELVREELNETIHLNESLGAPSSRAMEKLFAAIDAEGARVPARRSLDLAGRFAEFLSGFAPRTLAWSASAAALAIVLQAGVLATVVLKDHDRSAETQVAQQDTARWAGLGNLASSTNGQGPVVVLRFTPQATMTDVTKFLEAYNGVLVDGPKRGLYTARLAVSGTPTAEMPKVMQKIQAESKIVEFIAIKE